MDKLIHHAVTTAIQLTNDVIIRSNGKYSNDEKKGLLYTELRRQLAGKEKPFPSNGCKHLQCSFSRTGLIDNVSLEQYNGLATLDKYLKENSTLNTTLSIQNIVNSINL